MGTQETLAERAEIDALIEGRTVGDLLLENAERHGEEPAVSWKEGGAWRSLSWREYHDRVAEAAMGLRSLGVGRGDFVAIMAKNRPEHLIADLGALHAGATPVSFYNTLAPEQIAYIAGHCDAKVAVVEGREFMQRWEKVNADLPALERTVLIEDSEEFAEYDWALSWDGVLASGREALAARGGREAFDAMWQKVKPGDLATLVYTSGTTGPPKGVMVTQRNVLWTCCSLDRTGSYTTGLRAISYLPLAHALERLATHYLSMYKAAHVYFCPEVMQVFEYVPEVRPQVFAGVPRLFEKLQAGIVAALSAEPDERKRKIALRAIETGKRAVRLEQGGKRVPIGLRLQRALFDRLVYSKIREKIGLDQAEPVVSGAAPIPKDVLEFFWGIGVPIIEGYGMTESSAPATIGRGKETPIGTVGSAMPGCEVALDEDCEVLIRGGNVTAGYYKEEEKTAEAFDPDGWLHTGDIGELDERGNLRIVDRKKELIITAGGKNISPSNLESLLKHHPLVGQAVAIGDNRPYMSALIVLDAEVAPGWAAANGVPFTTIAQFAREPRMVAEIQHAVDETNQRVSHAEAIRRFAIVPAEWTVDSEELTPTLKLKRRVILQKYADQIESLYA